MSCEVNNETHSKLHKRNKNWKQKIVWILSWAQRECRQDNVLALGDRNDIERRLTHHEGDSVGSIRKARSDYNAEVWNRSELWELAPNCARHLKSHHRRQSRERKFFQSCTVRATKVARERAVLSAGGNRDNTKWLRKNQMRKKKPNLVLMSRVRKNIWSESVSSRSVQIIVLIDEILELQLHIGNFVRGKFKLLKRYICCSQKTQKSHFCRQ